MSDKTRIEWTDATWNPTTGCTKVSEGCRNCYAMTFAERFRDVKGHYFENGFDVTLREDKIHVPATWKRPRRIFVNSMSDLFHENVPFKYMARVFSIMRRSPQHQFQVLTKRPERMLEFMEWYQQTLDSDFAGRFKLPFPNVWLGVSVENQKAADERIPLLLRTPAAVRFLSCEPLLGRVDLSPYLTQVDTVTDDDGRDYTVNIPRVDWVIAGGESGPKARPMHPEWVWSLRDQCVDAGVPFFFDQWGEWAPSPTPGIHTRDICMSENGQYDTAGPDYICVFNESDGTWLRRVGKKKAGRMLDGRTWDEFPTQGGVPIDTTQP